MSVVLRIVTAAFWLATVAALVEHREAVAYCTGLVAIGIIVFCLWQRLDVANRSKYDSTYPAPADGVQTLSELVDEPSRTRRIVPARSDDKRGAA